MTTNGPNQLKIETADRKRRTCHHFPEVEINAQGKKRTMEEAEASEPTMKRRKVAEEGNALIRRVLRAVKRGAKQRRNVRTRAVGHFPQMLRNTEGMKRNLEGAEETAPITKQRRTDQDGKASPRRPPLKAKRGGRKAEFVWKRNLNDSPTEPLDSHRRKRKREEEEEDKVEELKVMQWNTEEAGRTNKRRKADPDLLGAKKACPLGPPKARQRLPRQAKANAAARIHDLYGAKAKRAEQGPKAAAAAAPEGKTEEVAMKGNLPPPNEPQKELPGRKKVKDQPPPKKMPGRKKVKDEPPPPEKQPEKGKLKDEPPPEKKPRGRKAKDANVPKDQKKGKGKPTVDELSEAEVKRLLLKGHELGSGAYGTAYKVLHKGKLAVLKVAIEDLWQVRAAFRNEAKTLQELQGAGGAPMLLGTCSKPAAILMDYCCGQEFYSFIYDSKTLPSLALQALPDIARRLHEIHLAGYIHADLKTDNVMVNEQVQPRIIDFGLAVKKGRKINVGQNMSDSIYAPEYTRGAPAQPWGDVYSMGCLVDDTIYALYDDIPKDYENIIKMAKNINPKLRPTVPELVEQLEAAWRKQNLQ
ncbi:dual specificity protein kinase shkE-like [Macrobrachium nipponense]|uniref:dual specificity protein kinase shkE-like n=1 Tax=Macrobrachium nipponense TaxID=159736 RepID=UPI0030C7D1D0